MLIEVNKAMGLLDTEWATKWEIRKKLLKFWSITFELLKGGVSPFEINCS